MMVYFINKKYLNSTKFKSSKNNIHQIYSFFKKYNIILNTGYITILDTCHIISIKSYVKIKLK